jgi:DNA (cytosine-5)-methyltransferase 1
MFKFIDLFAGVGGLSEGFRFARDERGQTLFEPLLLVDANASARQTYLRNHPDTPYLLADIAVLNVDQLRAAARVSKKEGIDALIGGPPCQGFSKLNKSTRQMLDDPRNALYGKFLEFVHALRPRFVLIENVPNLLDYDGGRYVEESVRVFEKAGYHVVAQVLAANEFGLPQLRKRAFIAAFLKSASNGEWRFPKGRFPNLETAREVNAAIHGEDDVFFSPPFVSVEDAIGDLPSVEAGQEIIFYDCEPFTDYQAARRRRAKFLANHLARAHDLVFIEKKLKKIPEGGSNQDLDGRRRFDRGREIKYLSQAYGRLHRHGIAQTITANFSNPGSGRFIHYRDHRSITVREAARLQGFDDDFLFCGRFEEQQRQVGNAVPPLLARALAEHFGSLLIRNCRPAA